MRLVTALRTFGYVGPVAVEDATYISGMHRDETDVPWYQSASVSSRSGSTGDFFELPLARKPGHVLARHCCGIAVAPPWAPSNAAQCSLSVRGWSSPRQSLRIFYPCAPSTRIPFSKPERYPRTSPTLTTSAYLACRSKRLCSCAARDRSPTASATTMGRSPF